MKQKKFANLQLDTDDLSITSSIYDARAVEPIKKTKITFFVYVLAYGGSAVVRSINS